MALLDSLIKCLREILPSNYKDTADPMLCLRSCIERYLNSLDENSDIINLIQNTETHEAYVYCCLHLFNSFAHLDAADDKSVPVFSVYQTQQISKCLEFVVCLGIYPLLSPGVSMPLDLRLERFDKFICPSSPVSENRIRMLSRISNCFDALLSSPIDALKDLFTPNKYLGDYLAVLLQLGFGPFPKTCLTSKSVLDLIRISRTRLFDLLRRLPRSAAFKQLFLFQSGFKKKSSEKKTHAPKWLCNACGRLITHLFVAPSSSSIPLKNSALKDLIVGVIDVHSTDPRHIPALTCSLGHILATPPSTCPSLDDYYSSLSSQINDACAFSKEGKESRGFLPQITRLVAVDTIHAICERDLDLGKRLFLSPFVSKLTRLVSTDENDNSTTSSMVIDLSDLEVLLTSEDLFSIVNFTAEVKTIYVSGHDLRIKLEFRSLSD